MARGRPRISEQYRRINQTIRLQRWVVEWLDHQKQSAGRLIETALINQYRLGMQKLEDDPEEYIPTLYNAVYYLAVMSPTIGGMAILDDGKWRRTTVKELEKLALSLSQNAT